MLWHGDTRYRRADQPAWYFFVVALKIVFSLALFALAAAISTTHETTVLAFSWSAILTAVALACLYLKRTGRLRRTSPLGFSIDDLQKLRDEGKLSRQEHGRAVLSLVASAEEPDSPTPTRHPRPPTGSRL